MATGLTAAETAIVAHATMQGSKLVVGQGAEARSLTGDEKAAVLLLALGPDFGRPILEELDEMEIKVLSRTMVRMGSVTQDMVDSLYAEFVTSLDCVPHAAQMW